MIENHFTLYELFSKNNQSEILTVIHDKNFSNNIIKLLYVLNEVRSLFGSAVVINSLYRSYRHNEKVGGSPTSQHITASAVDISPLDGNLVGLLKAIEDFNFQACVLGQVIVYSNFIHVALACPKHPEFQLYQYENGKLKKMD